MSRLALFVVLLIFLASNIFAQPQPQKKSPVATSPLCTRANAIDNTKQQILFTRTFDKSTQRISVLLGAADLLWPQNTLNSEGVPRTSNPYRVSLNVNWTEPRVAATLGWN